MTFSLDIRAHSEIGLVRKNNQDSGYASPTALVVADGMGGAAAGDLASSVAVAEVQRSDRATSGEDLVTALAGAVSRANDTIADLVAADHSLEGMGTTVSGAMFSPTQMGLVHIGDSRAYLFRRGVLSRLTHDHSWVQSLIDDGRITEEEAAVHPHRSLVLKVLNGHPTHTPDTALVDLELGDRLVFCSDGLCGFTTDDVIARALTRPDLDDVMDDLVRAAHLGGGADNITIVLAQVVPQDDALDAAPAVVIGAATTTEIPDLSADGGQRGGQGTTPEQDPRSPTGTGAATLSSATSSGGNGPGAVPEDARYRPTLRRRRPWLPVVVAITLVVAAGSALWGGWSWSRTQYYVGDSAGQVAIFNGVEGALLGRSLSRVTETTEIEVAGLPRFYRQQVAGTIKTSTLEAAHQTVEELRAFAGTCPPAPPGSASPTPLSSSNISSSPGTPTPSSPDATAPGISASVTPGSSTTSSPATSMPSPTSTPTQGGSSSPSEGDC